MESVNKLFNKLLVWNVFTVFFFFLWLAIALLGEQMHVHLGWMVWQRLWSPVIQPALGLMMAGAILSSVIPWIAARILPSDSRSR
jgi:hypothetical protein